MDEKKIIEEEWRDMCDGWISMRDVMMIALIEDVLPDEAYENAFENILEMLLDDHHDISIKSIKKLLKTYSEYWEKIFLFQPFFE
tara:strand:- start:1037 stop:1291 length:255 start_codon:yes stop_codon:yes gene_type:complete